MSVRFVRLYPSDWRSGCIGLSFEQEGLYIRICTYIYETERRLPLDDKLAAKLMGAHTNAYRKVRDQLAQLGKIERTETGWTVDRAERELAAATHSQGQAKRQADPERRRDTRQDTLGDTPHNTPIDTPLVFSEKTNEINGPLKSLNLNLSQKDSLSPSESDAARENGRTDDPNFVACKRALNGTTSRALDIVRNADGPYGTKATAAEWLAELIDSYGGDAVLGAVRFFDECQAKGQHIGKPKPWLSKNAARRFENARAAADKPKTKRIPVGFRPQSGEIIYRTVPVDA